MFTKDNRSENFLTQMGVDYVYTNDVTFAQLEDDWDTQNLARPVPLREDAVIEYAALMESGSAAPAPILHRQNKKSKLRILDGLQRLAAARLAGFTRFSAYIVTCDSEDVLAAIRVLANARLQGRAEPPEWTRRRAVEVLVIQRGLSVNEVARMGGWKPAVVQRLSNILDCGFKIRQAGGPELPDNLTETISKYLPDDELDVAAEQIITFLNTLKSARFSNSDAEPYVAEFFKPITKPSRRRQLYMERLDNFQEEPEVQTRIHGRRGISVRRDVTLMRTMKAAATVLDDIINEGDEVLNIDEFFHLNKTIGEKLRTLAPNQKAKSAKVPSDMWR